MDGLFQLGVIISVVDKLTGPVGRMVGSVQSLEKTLQRGQAAVDYGHRLGVSGALVQGAADKARGALQSLLQPVTEVEDAMAPLANATTSTMGSIQASMAASKRAAIDWSRQHVQSAAQFLQANYMMASAGLNDVQAIEGTRAALAVATATMGDQAEAANLLATLYNNVGDKSRNVRAEMTRLADIVTYTQQVFQFANFGQLNEGLTYAIPSALQYGSALEEVSVVLGQLNNAGLQGSMAGTAYAASMRQMMKASKELGFALARNQDGGISFIGTLENIRRKFGDFNDMSDRVKMAFQQVFGDEGLRAISVLLPKVGDLQKNLHDISNAAGITAKAQAGMESRGSAKLRILRQNWDALKIQIGDQLIPVINQVIPPVRSIVNAIGGFTRTHPDLARTATLVLAIGAGALAILAPILTVGSGIVMVTGYGIQGFARLGQAVLRLHGFLAGGGISRAIRAIGSGFETLELRGMYAMDGIKRVGSAALSLGRQAAISAAAGVRSLGLAIVNLGRQAITSAITGLPPLIASTWAFTAALLANPVTWVVAGLVALGAAIVALILHWDRVKAAVTAAWNTIRTVTVGAIGFLASGLSGLRGRILGAVQGALMAALNWVRGLFGMFRQSGAALWGAFVQGLTSVVNRPFEAVKGALQAVRKLLPFSDAKEGPLSSLTKSGAAMITTFERGIQSRMPGLKQAVATGFAALPLVMPAPVMAAPHVLPTAPGISALQTATVPEIRGTAIYDTLMPQMPAAPQIHGTATYDALMPQVEPPEVMGIVGYETPKVPSIRQMVMNPPSASGTGAKGSGRPIQIQELHLHVEHLDSVDELWTQLERFAKGIGG